MFTSLLNLLGGTRHARLHQKLAEQNINRRLFETSLDLILIVDRRGTFIRVSPSSAQIIGYTPEEMVGKSAVGFIHADDLEKTRSEMRLARRGRVMRNFDCNYIHRDGHVVPLYWTGVWSEPEQQHFFIGRDMTERIAQEDRLRRAQRLEAVGQLTGGIAHDFNNLLAVVIGNLDLLDGRVGDDRELQRYVDAAMQASLRGAELTRQLLAFARRQSLKAEILDINGRIEGTISLLRRTLGEGIEVATMLASDLWPAMADPGQFESALVNLAINARDAMQGNGLLTIETENRYLDADYCRQNTEVQPGDYIMLAVTDTGSGMAPEILAHVFEPFFTTKPAGQGTGLGLSMVYGFIRQSHGHIKIYSEPGHGATVRLYLPRAPADMHAAEVPVVVQLAARGGETILVVEDNADVRTVVVSQLHTLGYRVIEADSGRAALTILERGDSVDLLFTDVVMPGVVGGVQLANAARALRPDLKILLTSGFAKGSMKRDEDVAAFEHFLSKPYRKADLATKLRSVLDGKS